MHGRALSSLIVILILACTLTATAEILPEVGGLYYFVPASTVSGADAVWANPAGLGKTKAWGYLIMADYYDGEFADDRGMVLFKNSLAVGYRSMERPDGKLREYRFGMGAPLGKGGGYFGFNYQYYKDAPPGLHKKHLWNAGYLNQKNPKVAYAAVFSNLNRSRIDDERSEINMRYSVAYRPKGDRLTVSADMFLGTKTRLSNADFVYHAEVTAGDGIYFNSWVDSDKNFNFGFRVNLLKNFVGSQSSFDRDGNDLRTTAYYGATSLRQKSVIKEPRRQLSISLSGKVYENPPQPVIGPRHTSFTTLIQQIQRAAHDDLINELVIKLSGYSPGFGRAQELKAALAEFQAEGKRVICHLGRPGNLGYYIACQADSILIPPVSQFNLTGLRMELTFYKGLMDKLGIKAEVERIGDHKTAPEGYMFDSASSANEEQVNRLLDSFYDQFVNDIASARDLNSEQVRQLIDQGPFTSQEALELGLVDGLSYADDMSHALARKAPQVSFGKYQLDTLENREWGTTPVIAVIPLEGEIAYSKNGSLISPATNATPGRMTWALGRAVSDPEVKAIVLRINSPGGLALAGDEIYHQVEKAGHKKPVVISVANIAASGGYYAAMPGEKIFVNPACVTGSIGIYGGKADLSGLYEKLGITKQSFMRGDNANWLSLNRPFTEKQRTKYLSDLQAFYDYFVGLVSESRGLTPDSVDELGQGRVWTGREAVANGLADREGGLLDAARYAANLAGVKKYRVAPYPIYRPFFLLPQLSRLPYVGRLLKSEADNLEEALEEEASATSGVYARMPFDISIE